MAVQKSQKSKSKIKLKLNSKKIQFVFRGVLLKTTNTIKKNIKNI